MKGRESDMAVTINNDDLQYILEEILSRSQYVSELLTVNSLTGVNSLPAMKGSQVVNVPLPLLSQETQTAVEPALAAAQAAKLAAQTVATELLSHGNDNIIHIRNLGKNPNLSTLVTSGIYRYTIDNTYGYVPYFLFVMVYSQGNSHSVTQYRFSSDAEKGFVKRRVSGLTLTAMTCSI
jgi:hypothetical protein